MYYINIFFLFSLLGHIIENFVYTKVDSGILYGLWTPIYGVGALTIIFINKYLNKYKLKWYIKAPLLFIISAIILGIIETIGGYYIEIVFGRIFWVYYDHFVPIGKYTSLKMMLIWGLASIFLIYFLMPIVNKFIKKVPNVLTEILIFLFISDVLYTFYKLSNFSFF